MSQDEEEERRERDVQKEIKWEGRGGGQQVSALAFNSDDPSSNPAESTVFIL